MNFIRSIFIFSRLELDFLFFDCSPLCGRQSLYVSSSQFAILKILFIIIIFLVLLVRCLLDNASAACENLIVVKSNTIDFCVTQISDGGTITEEDGFQ